MSDALVEFIRARLDEDERDAQSTSGTATEREWEYGGLHAEADDPRDGVHIARHDPARVLRQCEVVRRMLQRHAEAKRDGLLSDRDAGFEAGMYAALEYIAAVWSDHSDYRKEWAPWL